MPKKLAATWLLASLLVPACTSPSGQRMNVSFDAVKQCQSDNVVVEEGVGLPAAGAVAMTAPAVAASGKTYTVAKGDSFNAIAKKFGCTPAELAAANGITNRNVLKSGTVLKIPGKPTVADVVAAPLPAQSTAAPAAPTAGQRQSKPWMFWQQQNTATRGTASQRQAKPWQIQQRQTATNSPAATPAAVADTATAAATSAATAAAPAVQAKATQAASYIVRSGDSLGAIAQRNGTTVSALMSANGMTKAQADKLRVGQKIILPAAKH